MLGHLRFHRRGPSNPSSPVPDQLSPFDHGEHPQSVQDISSRPDFLPRPTNASNTPPVHPSSSRPEQESAPGQKPPEQHVRSPLNSIDSGFIGGLALQNYRRAFESSRPESSEAAAATQGSSAQEGIRTKPVPPPINTNLPSTRPPPMPIKEVRTNTLSSSSFVAPTDLQSNVGATGKRPAGTRLTSEPPMLARSQTAAETQRAKKGLPFLKNPMSGLLMRRKASQNAPDLRPLPLPQKSTESTYDPRIRGTRVHDFSAPRQRVIPTRKPTVPGAEVWTGWDKYHNGPQSNASDLPLRMETSKSSSAASEATQAATSDGDDTTQPDDRAEAPSQVSAQAGKMISLEDKPLPAKPSGPNHVAETTTRSVSTTSRPVSVASSMQRTNPSTRTNRSRHISLSEDTLSALPKHMKSTSSRFSFDMIGAARAEKLLEERHRQRELERKANGGAPGRDSGFDDFDEDTFDYDAAMDDGGLEEAIPGVNADYEDHYYEEDIPMVGDDDIIDDEDDPDNDQENFAGFVFSRSNPQSSLVSPATPGMVITPRDASGRPIGHAITTDRTPGLLSVPSPLPVEDVTKDRHEGLEDVQVAGLGIQGLQAPQKTQYDPTVFQERRNMPIDDASESANTQDKGIYYDAGLLEELQMEADEIQKADFDESIFDDDDTDHFGRPIPGAFAQNLAMREHEQKKRESDVTSRSETSSTTAHTSVSVGMPPVQQTDKDAEVSKKPSSVPTSPPQGHEDTAAAYQKALADAAHKAAAVGWKSRWDDGPESSAPVGDPDPSSAGLQDDQPFQADDYEDDGFGGGFDDEYDDDLLDEAFIAEANAEALAYDSEGFYGDEFGFYSAPIPARNGFHGYSAPASGSSVGNESQYGGYFGPSGAIGRSASGRVLREPNLTPITERSEYSNRNSMMSMVLPSATLSDLRNSMASPNFAHMVPGADDSETFSLSGLQRLRGKTFGGSQISLSSSRDGSPRSERAPLHERFDGASSPAPWELGRPQSHLGSTSGAQPHERKNSAYSVWSNSDAASAAGSPTLTPSPGPQCPPVFEDEAEEVPNPGTTLADTPVDSEAEPSAVIPLTGDISETVDGASSLGADMDSSTPSETTQTEEALESEDDTSAAVIMTPENGSLEAQVAYANNAAFKANAATVSINKDISVCSIPLSPASLDSPRTPPLDAHGSSLGRIEKQTSSVSLEDDHPTFLRDTQIPRSIFALEKE
ncbi:hypothetical protein M406DRAFT_345942 [Cryphonectria parasitica EP155]|uniref:AGC-kinase C-terminal domain-containing protein n=1 Tax=Cryphonectria parasitica (strain ATCC 38755 / EP155) TaxID=660469 RepID=A0A9P4Y2V2_CRYP1|nr:uncharacterized protein M406DRAFT_345942 [Cryphonectria parasitica EP155]KAF3765616.1 hypothetical protein M406DRAFT_345942 [Cryphonectria parasitica EP155]